MNENIYWNLHRQFDREVGPISERYQYLLANQIQNEFEENDDVNNISFIEKTVTKIEDNLVPFTIILVLLVSLVLAIYFYLKKKRANKNSSDSAYQVGSSLN